MKTKLFTLLFAIAASTMMANALQTYTVSEAIAAFDAGTLMTGDSCQIIGAISKWCPKTTAFSTYKSISYYVTDGAKEFEFYCSYSLGKAQYKYYNYNSDSSALCVDMNGKSLFLGDTVIGAGKIKKYGDIYEFDMNCYLKEIRPAKQSPFIVAEGTCGDNATWAITYPGWVLNITGDGAIQRSNNYWDLYKLYIDSVAIGEGITEIGDSAFYNCSSMTSAIVPNSITSIGNMAFDGCPSLTSVHISDLAAWCNISFRDYSANPLMSAHNLYLNGDLITDLVIPNSVTKIGNYAFTWCTGFVSVTIPNGVTSIGSGAFCGCTGLTSVEIPNSVTSIGDGAFEFCMDLTSIEIPNSVTKIGNYAFDHCNKLTSVTIPNSVTSIGDHAFETCWSLTSFEIPNSITCIGDSVFYSCSGLTSITIPNSVTSIGNSAFRGCTGLTSIEMPNSVASIGNYAFHGCTGLTSATIGNSVTSIGSGAFAGCTGLTSVEIPNSVTSIGNSAFSGCTGLTSVAIGNSVTSIGNQAFYNCKGLTSIEIPNSVTSIGNQAFYNCKGLTSVTIGNSVDSIDYETFSGCKINQIHYSGTLQEWIGKSWDPTFISSNYSLYIGDELLKDLIIPNDITSIRSNAFACCNSLTSVTIPNSVTSIGVGAFNNCSSLNSVYISDLAAWCNISFGAGGAANPLVTAHNLYLNGNLVTDLVLPNTVTVIKAGTFVNCTCLTSVTIPNSVNTIEGALALQNEDQGIIYILGCGAFQGCTGLTSVTIPNSVDSIGAHAFYDCNRLSSVYVLSEEPPTLSRADCFPTSTTIYVPCGRLETYQTAEGWSAYASNMRYEPSLLAKLAISMTPMEGGYIEGITDSISVCLNSDFALTAIPNDGYCFTQWSDGNIDNPRIIAVSQDTTFSAEFGIAKKGTCGVNRALTWEYEEKSKTLTISGEGELTENYMYGFEAPTQMQKLVIGNDVTAIGDSAFYAMNTINHLFIGSGVASIGNYAFAECRNFDDITCYATTVPTINATTFYNVGNKQYIYLYVPADRERAYKRDTYWGEFDIQIQSAESTTTGNEIKIEPTDNTAAVTWPVVDGADSYELVIKDKEGNVICTLVFNAQGQLTSIAFNAPGRNAPQQTQTAGFSFTVTGLEEGTSYDLTLTAKDSGGNTLDSKTVSFSTEGYAPQGIDQITNDNWQMTNKIIKDGQIFILRGNKTYTVTGVEVK